jgi:hypothetical protein
MGLNTSQKLANTTFAASGIIVNCPIVAFASS